VSNTNTLIRKVIYYHINHVNVFPVYAMKAYEGEGE